MASRAPTWARTTHLSLLHHLQSSTRTNPPRNRARLSPPARRRPQRRRRRRSNPSPRLQSSTLPIDIPTRRALPDQFRWTSTTTPARTLRQGPGTPSEGGAGTALSRPHPLRRARRASRGGRTSGRSRKAREVRGCESTKEDGIRTVGLGGTEERREERTSRRLLPTVSIPPLPPILRFPSPQRQLLVHQLTNRNSFSLSLSTLVCPWSLVQLGQTYRQPPTRVRQRQPPPLAHLRSEGVQQLDQVGPDQQVYPPRRARYHRRGAGGAREAG